jgi:hypothetical protein
VIATNLEAHQAAPAKQQHTAKRVISGVCATTGAEGFRGGSQVWLSPLRFVPPPR